MSAAERPSTYADGIAEALGDALASDPSVFIMGEDVAAMEGIHGHMRGLAERFGAERVRDAPISEAGFIGAAAGAAAEGFRPVVELMTIDFFGVAMDQIYNHLAKLHYASAGERRAPVTIIASTGNPLRQGVTHAQTLHGTFAHLPGLKVVLPASPADAKGLLSSAIADDSPVVYLFHRALLPLRTLSGPDGDAVPAGPHAVPLGEAVVRRPGSDVTIVATSFMVSEALRAIPLLEAEGIDAEILDLRTLVPLDLEAILGSLSRTRRLLVLDEDYRSFGASGELIALVAERMHGELLAPPARIARADTPVPYSRVLEDAVAPTPQKLVEACGRLVEGRPGPTGVGLGTAK
ncbi:MAG: alpha-ketoacid dehydrogenase subunit beta [Actinobacteria bacterium]|nr:alpha-ketoacid dehydrogenase subunit beta [Actinomycetota bacterium]